MSQPIRLVEIAELLGVTNQRTSVIVRQPGLRRSNTRIRAGFWDRRDHGVKRWRREKPWR
jgi:hypothetical protein